jgi:hypothetical protein
MKKENIMSKEQIKIYKGIISGKYVNGFRHTFYFTDTKRKFVITYKVK